MVISVDATKEALATAYTGLGRWISLHTGDPGTTGANEATGGSPAYARKQTTWSVGGVDGIQTGSPVEIDIPAGTYLYAGIWSVVSGGTFVDKVLITPAIAGAQARIVVTPTYNQS